jgi:hypothetical protein
MSFQTFYSCGQSNENQSLDLPADDKPIDFKIHGNRLTLMVEDSTVVLRWWSRSVSSFVQVHERQKLVQRIRRLDEAIGQLVLELMKLRSAWRLRYAVPNAVPNAMPNAVPNSFQATKYDVLQKKLSMYNTEFVQECTALHQIWPLEPEIGDEYHEWIVPLGGLSAIFLPDLRPGKEGQNIEVCFWFGKEAPNPPAKALTAMVTIVPRCHAPYRPFKVPAVWV